MEMVTRAFDSIGLKHRTLLIGELEQIRELRTDTWARARQTLRIFALLHDVGHPAFSHAAEDVIPGGNHEDVSRYVVEEVLSKMLQRLFYRGIVGILTRLFNRTPDTIFLRGFVAGEMDMDR